MMNLQSLVLEVETYMQRHLAQYLEALRTLCSIDSFSSHKPGLDEMALHLATRMRELSMEVTVIEREGWGNDLLGKLRGAGGGRALLLGHTDTVYPVGTAAARPMRLDGDTVYGPGVCDMKGALLSGIYALEALLTAGYSAFGEIWFLCVSDEEISTRHSKDILEAACQHCDAALVLEAARSNGDIVSARKGIAWYTLTAHGRAAHAGVEPGSGSNAVLELAHQIVQLTSLNRWRDGLTINPGVIAGGTVPNVVPDFAQARFDVRYLLSQDRVDTEEQWRKMTEQPYMEGVTLTLERDEELREPMVCTPETLKLVTMAQQIASFLGFAVKHVHTGGISDANYASTYGIPVLDGLGPIGGDDHSPDEYLMASSVAPRTALLAGLIASIGANGLSMT